MEPDKIVEHDVEKDVSMWGQMRYFCHICLVCLFDPTPEEIAAFEKEHGEIPEEPPL
jgi:hypothetical protein